MTRGIPKELNVLRKFEMGMFQLAMARQDAQQHPETKEAPTILGYFVDDAVTGREVYYPIDEYNAKFGDTPKNNLG